MFDMRFVKVGDAVRVIGGRHSEQTITTGIVTRMGSNSLWVTVGVQERRFTSYGQVYGKYSQNPDEGVSYLELNDDAKREQARRDAIRRAFYLVTKAVEESRGRAIENGTDAECVRAAVARMVAAIEKEVGE